MEVQSNNLRIERTKLNDYRVIVETQLNILRVHELVFIVALSNSICLYFMGHKYMNKKIVVFTARNGTSNDHQTKYGDEILKCLLRK